MKNTARRKRNLLIAITLWLCMALLPNIALSQIRLSSEWDSRYRADGSSVPDSEHEIPKLDKAAEAAVVPRNAVLSSTAHGRPDLDLSFKLYIGQTKFYMQPALFMAKNRPGETCTPLKSNTLNYDCVEGQHYAKGCHVFFFDANFAEVGFHTIKVNEPYVYYCNAVPAVGIANKEHNELLVTVQYFPVDRKHASKVSEIGSGWNRMTVLRKRPAIPS